MHAIEVLEISENTPHSKQVIFSNDVVICFLYCSYFAVLFCRTFFPNLIQEIMFLFVSILLQFKRAIWWSRPCDLTPCPNWRLPIACDLTLYSEMSSPGSVSLMLKTWSLLRPWNRSTKRLDWSPYPLRSVCVCACEHTASHSFQNCYRQSPWLLDNKWTSLSTRIKMDEQLYLDTILFVSYVCVAQKGIGAEWAAETAHGCCDRRAKRSGQVYSVEDASGCSQ